MAMQQKQDDSERSAFDETEFQEASLRSSGVPTSVTRALLNCMDATEICSYLEQCYPYVSDLRNEFLVALGNIVRDHSDQLAVVRAALTRLMSINEADLASAHRTSLDATVGRLARLLPAAEQVALAPIFLLHRRAARRRTGAYMVGNHPEQCSPDIKMFLLEAYERRRDPEVLVPLSRLSTGLSDVAPMLLTAFTRLNDPQSYNRPLNEQARVFARLAVADLPQAVTLAEQYPTAFVFGVGKAGQQDALPYVLDILAHARKRYETASRLQFMLLRRGEWSSVRGRIVLSHVNTSAERLRLCIWTLGQLRAREATEALAKAYDIRWPEVIYLEETGGGDDVNELNADEARREGEKSDGGTVRL